MVKYDSKEEFEERDKANLHTSSKKSNVDFKSLVQNNRSTDDD